MRVVRTAWAGVAWLACAAVLAVYCASPARAAWDPSGYAVVSADAPVPVVSALADGANGGYVAWVDPAGRLRVQHLLASGDLDASWPASGTVACSLSVTGAALSLVRASGGDVLVSWLEGVQPVLQRLRPDGAIREGWPTRGALLSLVDSPFGQPAPHVIADAEDGVYVAWMAASASGEGYRAWLARLGPTGSPLPGWPRRVTPSGLSWRTEYWPRVALAADGGAFVSWGTLSADSTVASESWRLARFDPAGARPSGWGIWGVEIGGAASHWTTWTGIDLMRTRLTDLRADGVGGVVSVTNGPESDESGFTPIRLTRWSASGQPVAGWPSATTDRWVQGRNVPTNVLDLQPDGSGGWILVVPSYFSEGGLRAETIRLGSDGRAVWSNVVTSTWWEHEQVWSPPSGLHGVTTHACVGLYYGEPHAFLYVLGSAPSNGWYEWSEVHSTPATCWYGDVALVPSGQGDAILFWSQQRERVGVFARRLPPVNGSAATEAPLSFGSTLASARFVTGQGVRVALAGAVPVDARVALFDVGGRRIATHVVGGSEARPVEFAMPGTVMLSPGLYFVRMESEPRGRPLRVVVVR